MKKSTSLPFNELNSFYKNVFSLLVIVMGLTIAVSGQTNVVITTSGTWTVPLGVTSVDVGCYGAGGGGGGARANGCTGGGGGGGGAFSKQTITVSPGEVYNLTIGQGGTAGASNGSSAADGGIGGTTTFTGIGGTCSAFGGPGGIGVKTADWGTTKPGVSGASGGVGFLYAGGNGGGSYDGSWSGSGGGGGGAGNGGPGGNATGSGNQTGGVGGAGTYPGGAGGTGYCCNGNNAVGRPGSIPGGGGSGGSSASCSGGTANVGGVGAAGQILLTYTINPVCTSCPRWLNQYCPTLPTGSYIDGGTITPSASLQNIATATNAGSYGYVFWTFNGVAGETYYFDLCSSTGTSGSTWLRLHDARNTSPSNNYCMNASNTPTLILQNLSNGCTGTGIGLSKLIWTCTSSGTYYLESAIGVSPAFWGVSGTQSASLSYRTLPSSSTTCSDNFYDKGITGTDGSTSSYNNNESWIYTYYPTDTVTEAINVQFTSFSTSPGDILCIYNGNSINATQIGCYSGPSITGAFSSSANDGSLTFKFTSDDSLISTGWNANVTCVPSLRVGSYNSENKINLFPNPVKDKLELSGLKLNAHTKIQIFDIAGKAINLQQPASQLTDHSSQQKITLQVGSLSSGVYIIRLENEESIWNGKFVKE